MPNLIYYAIPGFLLTMLAEVLWARHARKKESSIRGYDAKDSASSLSLGVANLLVSALVKGAVFVLWTWLYQHRVATLPVAWWTWLLLFFAEDFCYYWFHRAHHEVRFFWAAHVNHHSSTYYNLSTALRQSWTTPLTSIPFWLPLLLLGFDPSMLLVQKGISLLYQYWLHTEALGSLGPFEWVFNTPSHHRVHHGTNVEYLDRNHGGILIVWDRLFGTFEPEVAPVRYGLTTNLTTHNPIQVGFHEWIAIARDVRAAKSMTEVFGFLFGPPGWSADGSRKTSAQLRAEKHAEPTSNGLRALEQ